MAGGDSGFVVGEDPDCYLEYKLRDDCWSETLTSSYGYKSMPYNALVALFPQPRERPVSWAIPPAGTWGTDTLNVPVTACSSWKTLISLSLPDDLKVS